MAPARTDSRHDLDPDGSRFPRPIRPCWVSPGSRTPFTRDPVLGLRAPPPWRLGTGPLRFSFEAFTSSPCNGVFGFASIPIRPVLANGPNPVARRILVAAAGSRRTLPRNIKLSSSMRSAAKRSHPRPTAASTRQPAHAATGGPRVDVRRPYRDATDPWRRPSLEQPDSPEVDRVEHVGPIVGGR